MCLEINTVKPHYFKTLKCEHLIYFAQVYTDGTPVHSCIIILIPEMQTPCICINQTKI